MQRIWFLKPIHCSKCGHINNASTAADGANCLDIKMENTNYLCDGKSSKISLINAHLHTHTITMIAECVVVNFRVCTCARLNEMPLAFIYPSNWLICSDLFKRQMNKLPTTNPWIKTYEMESPRNSNKKASFSTKMMTFNAFISDGINRNHLCWSKRGRTRTRTRNINR